jgi:threonine synthase
VKGTREAVAVAAQRAASDQRVYHLDHNRSDAFVAGMTTLAFELRDAFGTLPPIVMPVGGGSLLAGCARVFGSAGTDAPPPPLFAVQPAACAPLVRALENGWDVPLPVDPLPTVAGGISIANPPRGRELISAITASNGGATAVGEEAILHWGRLLARLEGVYAEPTSAAAVAGLAKLVAGGQIGREGSAVVVITGSGLKDPEHSGQA